MRASVHKSSVERKYDEKVEEAYAAYTAALKSGEEKPAAFKVYEGQVAEYRKCYGVSGS